ncbi:sulfotransferase domain-containing protein [Bacteroidota bacterium]
MTYKNLIKTFLRPLHRHTKEGKDIYIFTLPRSGSSLLAEIISINPKINFIGEPLLLNKNNKENLLKYFDKSFLKERYVELSDSEQEKMFAYFNDLSNGKTLNSINWSDFFSSKHNFNTNRTLFKTHKITSLFSEFNSKLELDIIYLLRHPISHSLSRMRNNWATYISYFLQYEKISNKLNNKQIELCKNIEAKGSALEKFCVSWCLENYELFELIKMNKIPKNLHIISYEELLYKPDKSISKLCDFIKIPFHQKMLDKINRPSKGIVHSNKETEQKIKRGDRTYLIEKWKEKVNNDDEERIFEILNSLDINFYEINNPLPNKKYLTN